MGYEFDLWFPVLAKTLNSLPAMTNFEAVRRSLKYASEDFYNWTTREFLTAGMRPVLAAVGAELTAVLEPYWAQLAEQSGGVLAAHSILAVWRATKLDIYSELAANDRNVVKWACLLCDIAKLGAP